MENRVLETFLRLVAIDSESYHEAAIAAYVCEVARECGFACYVDGAGGAIGGESGNVYVRLPSTGVAAPPLLLSAHLDTVRPGSGVGAVLKGGRIVSRGDTVLGADCKAGVAACLEIMRLSSEGAMRHGPMEMLFTVAEEMQLLGSRHVDWERIEARHAFVLDGAGGVGDIVNASPTQDNLDFAFTGRAAHSGVEPEKGINAIYGAARAIGLMRLGRIDSETTANIGRIEGGRAVNIVPEKALARGEVRSLDARKLEEQKQAMIRAAMEAEASVGVGVEVGVERAYEGYLIDPGDPLVLLVQEAGRAMGMQMRVTSSGGGSDANNFNARGIRSLVLSMGAREPHTVHEHLEVRDLERLTGLCREIASSAGRLRSAD